MKVQIQVTQDDISQGRPSDVRACPVALAMTRVLGDRFEQADLDGAEVDGCPVAIPTKVCLFMEAFDLGDPVQPFQFTVNLPDLEPAENHP